MAGYSENPRGVPDQSGRRGVIAVIPDAARYLIIRRSTKVVAPRALCFPGGGIESGETELEALDRECREELGTPVQPRRRIWENRTPWNVHLAWWLCHLPPKTLLTPDPAEVEAVLWMTLDELAGHPDMLESNRPFLDQVAQGRVSLAEG